MATYNDNYQLKQFLTKERIIQETNTRNPTPANLQILQQIFSTPGQNMNNRRIFINNSDRVMRFPIIPNQNINGVNVDMGFQESLCKKNFADIMTNFISSEKSFADERQENITRFQLLINKTYTTAIAHYRNRLKETTNPTIQETDILFIYKGGTTMKLLFDKYQPIFNKLSSFDEIKEFFLRSDSDYGIFINPTLENFDEVYININKISTLCLNFIRTQINNNPDFFVPLSIINIDDIRRQVQKMNDKLDEMKEEPGKTPYCDSIRNIARFIGMSYLGNHEFLEDIPELNNNNTDNFFSKNDLDSTAMEEFKNHHHINTTRSDFYLTYADGNYDQKILGTFNRTKNDIYLTVNEANEYPGINDAITAFCLHRLKINFIVYYKTKPDENGVVKYGYFSCPSELVDVSIMKQTSNDLRLIYQNINYEFIDYNYILKQNVTFKNQLKIIFKSYSTYGHISDLCLILFIQNNKPWDNNKYAKRLNRLLYFIILEIMSFGQKLSIMQVLGTFTTLIDQAQSISRLGNPRRYSIKNNMQNITIPLIIGKFNEVQRDYHDRQYDKINIHFASIKFFNYYNDLLNRLDLNNRSEMRKFRDFNNTIGGFLYIINKSIVEMKKVADSFFSSTAISTDGSIRLKNLGGSNKFGDDDIYEYTDNLEYTDNEVENNNDDNDKYKMKYLKYKTKYLKLKSLL